MSAHSASAPSGFRALRHRVLGRWKHRPGIVPFLLFLPAGAFIGLLGILPERWALAIGAAIGRVAWWSPRRRRVGRAHLASAMPELDPRARDRLLRRSCAQLGRTGVEIVLVGRRWRPRLGERVRWEPGTREQLAQLRGRALVGVLPHLGSVDVAGGALGIEGLRPVFPMRRPSNYYTARWLENARDGCGVTVIPRQGAVRRLLSQLKSGGTAVLATDQSAHHAPVFVHWFGRLAATERTAAALALRSGAPVLVFWCTREAVPTTWTFGCELVRPESAPELATDEAVIALTERMHRAMERAILNHPEQYLWIHDRYRVRPEGESPHA